MIGSLPMSLSELPMAPAIIASMVRKKGYNFKFVDINLELFKECNQNFERYYTRTQMLQQFNETFTDNIIQIWEEKILKKISESQYLIVNVFSHFSQATAYRFIKQVRQLYPDIKIFVGGIGSQKKVSNSDSDTTRQWINNEFKQTDSDIFGKLLFINGLVDSWQSD